MLSSSLPLYIAFVLKYPPIESASLKLTLSAIISLVVRFDKATVLLLLKFVPSVEICVSSFANEKELPSNLADDVKYAKLTPNAVLITNNSISKIIDILHLVVIPPPP